MTRTANFHDIERLAYFLYVNRGRQEGQAVAHWLEAEAQISDYTIYSAQGGAGPVGFSARLFPADDPQG